MSRIQFLFFLAIAVLGFSCVPEKSPIVSPRKVWTPEQANAWYATKGWLRGSDFIPSTAINQLEMWQAESFDTITIDRELGWAQDLGFNSMRVYFHHAAWRQDPEGFFNRVDRYLNISARHGISTMFTLFDDCWNPVFQTGRQPDPKPGIHNSGWLRDPGEVLYQDSTVMPTLEEYVKAVLTRFGNDERILLWDLYNEPGNSGYGDRSIPLLKNAFAWARSVNPSQPLSVGYWNDDLKEINRICLEESDVITYHNYNEPDAHQRLIDTLRTLNKPLLCTEYMARTRGSLFQNILPMLKQQNIGAYNWGFVSGKTNTIYAWSDPRPDGSEPPVWFHDILRKDGSPYDTAETNLIRRLTAEEK